MVKNMQLNRENDMNGCSFTIAKFRKSPIWAKYKNVTSKDLWKK